MTLMSAKFLVTSRDHTSKISCLNVPRDWYSGLAIDHIGIARPYHGMEDLQIVADKVVR